MVSVELDKFTLSTLVAGLYCSSHQIDSMAIPHSVWIEIAEKLEYFIPTWNYEKISFEDWVDNCLLILPKELLTDPEIMELQKDTLYWERLNGNVVLIISMDIGVINDE